MKRGKHGNDLSCFCPWLIFASFGSGFFGVSGGVLSGDYTPTRLGHRHGRQTASEFSEAP